MSMRQYTLIIFFGVIITFMIPKSENLRVLDESSVLQIFPTAGPPVEAVQVSPGLEIAHAKRLGLHVLFQMTLDGQAYVVQGSCDPAAPIAIDPDLRIDQQKVKTAITWACTH